MHVCYLLILSVSYRGILSFEILEMMKQKEMMSVKGGKVHNGAIRLFASMSGTFLTLSNELQYIDLTSAGGRGL